MQAGVVGITSNRPTEHFEKFWTILEMWTGKTEVGTNRGKMVDFEHEDVFGVCITTEMPLGTFPT